MPTRLALISPVAAVVLAGSLGLFSAFGPAATAAPAVTSTQITVATGDYWFDPSELVVQANQPVQFVSPNMGAERHRVDFAAFGERWRGEETRPGDSTTFEMTFALPGVYEMWCPYSTPEGVSHRSLGMEGSLVVTEAM